MFSSGLNVFVRREFTLVCRPEKKVRRGAEYDDMLILLTTIVMAARKRVPSFDRFLSLSRALFQLARDTSFRASVDAPSFIRTVSTRLRVSMHLERIRKNCEQPTAFFFFLLSHNRATCTKKRAHPTCSSVMLQRRPS